MAFARRKAAWPGCTVRVCGGSFGAPDASVAELKRLLRERAGGQSDGEALVEAVVHKLKEQRYLNDSEYAAAYSAYRRENEKFGRWRVISDLKSRGIHGDIIAKTVGEAYAGINEEKLAREHLARKRVSKPADGKEAAKVFRALMRAGFSTPTIIGILKKWHVEDEIIGMLEGEY